MQEGSYWENSKVTKNIQKFYFSEGHNILCKQIGRNRSCKQTPKTRSTKWNQNLRFVRVVFKKSLKNSKKGQKNENSTFPKEIRA